MPSHTVQQGESIDSIARQHKVRADAIWDAPENRELRERRRHDARVLFENDEVFIPVVEPKRVAASTGRYHEFVHAVRLAPVRIRFTSASGATRNVPCKVTADSHGEEFDAFVESDGILRLEVPPETTQLDVRLWPDTAAERAYCFKLRHLDPVDEIRGVQQRLNNLGFRCGEPDGSLNDPTRAAIRSYQRSHGLEVSGEVDAATTDSLRRNHGT
jgi:hypothetical protein